MNLFDRFLNRVTFDTGEGGAGGEGGEGGSSGSGWLSSVPENLRTHEAFKGIEKASDAWKQFVDLKVSSKNALHIPDENATDEERQAFFAKLGRPETPDKYDLKPPEGLRDGLYNEEVDQAFAVTAHKLGLTVQQVQGIHNWYYETVKAGDTQETSKAKESFEKTVAELKNKWPGDSFKKNTELAHRAFKTFAGESEQAKDFLEKTIVDGVPLGNHPVFLEGFLNFAKQVSEDSLGPHGDHSGRELSDEERARQRFPNTQFH